MVWLFVAIAAVIVIAAVILFLNRFYRKATRDVALIRTGAGGQRVVMDGGTLSLPFLHQVSEVNMKTTRIETSRGGPKALITGDRLRVDVEVEFTVRVTPTPQGVATAAQALGGKAFRPQDLADLIEGRLIDAMQAVAARHTMDELHEGRGAYVREVKELVAESLAQNGLTLESVALRRFDQTPFGAVDENNAFNAVGLRRLAEVIASNKKQRAAIEADADVAVRQSQLDAMKRVTIIEQEQEQARLNQHRTVEQLKADAQAQIAEHQALAQARSEQARIAREREVRLQEIARDQELRQRDLQSTLETELNRRDNAIRMAQKKTEEAAAEATAEQARTSVVLAMEAVQTEKEKVQAERAREIAAIRSAEEEAVEASKLRIETETIRDKARAEAEASTARAAAGRDAMLAESEGRAALIAAENGLAEPIIRMRLEERRLKALPELVAHLVKPAEKIQSIRINQITGLGQMGPGGGGANGGGTTPDKPLVNQAVDGILGMALQLPAVQKLGQEIGLDIGSGLSGLSKAIERRQDD